MADIRNFLKYKPLKSKNRITYDGGKLFLSDDSTPEKLEAIDLPKASPDDILKALREAELPFAGMLEERKKSGKIEKIVISCLGGFDAADTEKGILGAKILLLIFSLRGVLVALDKNDSEGISAVRERFGEDDTVERALMPTLFPLENRRILGEVLFPGTKSESVLVMSFPEAICLYEALVESKKYTGHKMRFVLGKAYTDLFVPDGFRISDMLTAGTKIFSLPLLSCKEGVSALGGFLPSGMPVDASMSALTFFPYEEKNGEGRCIGCAACRNVCPVGCMPDLCVLYGEKAPVKEIEKCALCGLCNEKCPAGIDIAGTISIIREGCEEI